MTDFSSIYNHHEVEVFAAIQAAAPNFPGIDLGNDVLCDVACVALNRLPPRYIRHAVDFSFYLTDNERREINAAIEEAVNYAFHFVEARTALRQQA
ncbi:MAG: late competence development ComFB family protein [Pelomonas sp.]|nr:late competence development ComFB family protein [Roseateles sp.]